MSCTKNHTYFWNAEFLHTAYHITAIFCIPMTVLLFYCILYETPKRMESMKPALLNLQIWVTNMDIFMTVFCCPYVFFPSAAGFTVGILSNHVSIKWQAYYYQLSTAYLGIAMIKLYENRQSQVSTITWKFTKKSSRIIYYTFNYIILSLIFLPFYMTNTDQDELREYVLQRIPCPTVEFFTYDTYVVLRGDEKLPFYSISGCMLIVVSQTAFFLIHALLHLVVLKNQQLSKATKAMQKKYLATVSVQFSLPVLALVVPSAYILYSDKASYYNQAYNNFTFIAISNHGLVSSLLALYIYKPYRDFCLGKIFRTRNRSVSVLVALMCNRSNHTYFWSGEFLHTAYHITALFTIPMAVLLFYCILYETPKRMESMKPALLNLQIWLTSLDLVMTVFCCPLVYFPSASGIPLGLLSNYVGVKWQSYACQLFIAYIGIALIMLFENRQSQVMTITFKINKKRTRVIYYILNYIILSLVYLPFYMTNTDQDELREYVLQRIPCPTLEFFDNTTYVVLRGDEKLPFYSVSICMFLIVGQTGFFLFHALYHLVFLKNYQLSEATKAMQKKYLGCVSIQFSLPMLALVFPAIYTLYSDKSNYYNQAYNNFVLLTVANHGLLSSLSAIYIYKPYRDFCLEKIFRRKAQSVSILPSVQATSQIIKE